jgi:4-amino-4-deoxychorismate lyase
MREFIMTESSLSISCQQKNILMDELLSADEIFICNSVIGIWPVIQLHANPIKNFTVGKITRELQAALYRDYQGG